MFTSYEAARFLNIPVESINFLANVYGVGVKIASNLYKFEEKEVYYLKNKYQSNKFLPRNTSIFVDIKDIRN